MAEARILNVNDDPIGRQVVTRLLRDAGFEVLEAASGRQALLEASQPLDLVIVAVELRDIDGLEVTRRLRANSETRLLPVLQLSTNGDAGARALGLQSGAEAYLTEPVQPAELLATVRATLRAWHGEREQRRALEQHSVILRHLADAVTAQNAAGKVVYANDAALRLLGYDSTAQFVAGNDAALTDAFDMRDEQGRPLDPATLPARRVLAGEPEARALIRWRRRDGGGEDRWTMVQSSPVRDESGRVILAINVLHDFTQWRRSEQRMALLSEASALITASLDYAEVIDRLVRLLVPRLGDWSVLHLIEGADVRWVAAHSDPALDAQLRALAATPVPLSLRRVLPDTLFTGRSELTDLDDAVLATRIDGESQRAFVRSLGTRSIMCAPLTVRGHTIGALNVASGQPGRYVLEDLKLLEDLAHRVALAVDNARAYRRAAEASELRRDLVAVVAHDLKNPLNAVTMAAALLGRAAAAGSEGDRARRQASIITRASERMNRLIHDLLDVSAIDAGRLELDEQPLGVGALVTEAVEAMAHLAQEKQIAIERSLAPAEETLTVRGDRERLLQVFSNLLGNAIKFAPAGGRVSLHAARRDGEVELSVRDNGPGIAPEHLPHVFDRFWRVRGSRRDGTGLGLWIVKGLVEAHGGSVSVDTAVGAGSTFHFTVPLAP